MIEKKAQDTVVLKHKICTHKVANHIIFEAMIFYHPN